MKPAIALIASNKAAWSETFIKAQRELLPADVHFLYGAWLPRFQPNGRHFLTDSPVLRALIYLVERIRGQERHTALRKRIARYLQKHKIVAVLAQYGPSGVEMLPVCRELGIPLIVHFHGYDAYEKDLLGEYDGRYPEMFEGAAAIVAVSKAMMRQLHDLGAPWQKLHYNPCGANLALFRPTTPGDNPPHFLAVGRFSHTKAPHITLQAFEMVAQRIPEARLTLAGDGPLFGTCQALVKRMGLEDKVEMPSVLRHEQVAAYMRHARAFVQHSVTTSSGDSEGTPVAIMEAGAAGLPVISTRHAGIPDVVIDEETGILVDEHDVRGMASAMIGLAMHPELANRMGKAARERMEAEFDQEKRVARLWDIIQSTIH